MVTVRIFMFYHQCSHYIFTILFLALTQIHAQIDVQVSLDFPKGHTANKSVKGPDLSYRCSS